MTKNKIITGLKEALDWTDIYWDNTEEIDRMRREARPYSEFRAEVLAKLNKPK